jgi:hypothetical protein
MKHSALSTDNRGVIIMFDRAYRAVRKELP